MQLHEDADGLAENLDGGGVHHDALLLPLDVELDQVDGARARELLQHR